MTIELFFSLILVFAGISCILELYLKFLEIADDSERIIIGVMKTSPIRFREETFQKGGSMIRFSQLVFQNLEFSCVTLPEFLANRRALSRVGLDFTPWKTGKTLRVRAGLQVFVGSIDP